MGDVPVRRFGREWWGRFVRHYLRDMVYAANDGLITTFAVAAGVRGADLSALVVLALSFANLAADGLSMAVGNYLGIKSERAVEEGDRFQEWEETVHASKHGAVTWAAFITAGLFPVLPFFGPQPLEVAFLWSVAVSGFALFTIGAARTLVTRRSWWRSGAEMLGVGALAGLAAYFAGMLVERMLR